MVWEEVSRSLASRLSTAEAMLVRGAVLVSMMRSSPGGEAVIKTHGARVIVDGVEVIPRSITDRAIYVARDPRDVASSLADHLGVGLDGAIEVMGTSGWVLGSSAPLLVGSWSENARSWSEEGGFPVHVVRYEDLLLDAVSELARICAFLGLDSVGVAQAVELASFDRLRAIEDERGSAARSKHQARFFRSGRAGEWREVLAPAQARRIERDHGEAMVALGYAH